MKHDKIDRIIDRIGFAVAWRQASDALRAALSRGVCPKCGERLMRNGELLTCGNFECDGVEEAQRVVRCYAKVRG